MPDNIKEKIKNRIIDLISLESAGRLIVFKPQNLDKDLVVEKKGGYKNIKIFLNVYEKELSISQSDSANFKEEIQQLADKKSLSIDENFYLLFVYFDTLRQNINDNFLVISSLDLRKIAKQNDFTKFLINRKDFVRFLIEKFKEKN